MPLDLSRLEKVKRAGNGRVIAQCPACAAADMDHAGQHLLIAANGAFTCCIHPGREGAWHRKEIYRLAGIQERRENRELPRAVWRLRMAHA